MFLLWAKVLQSRADVSIHICAGNVSLGQDTEYIEIQFQLIYVRGMFSCGHGDMTGLDSWGFNSHMCGECFRCNSPRRVQGRFNSYMRGECFGIRALSRRTHGVSTHICAGNVSFVFYNSVVLNNVSTHICAGNVSDCSGHYAGVCRCFNSYMRGECFPSGDLLMQLAMCFNSYMRGECFGES